MTHQMLRARKGSGLTQGGSVDTSTSLLSPLPSTLILLVLAAAITTAAIVNPVTPSTRPVGKKPWSLTQLSYWFDVLVFGYMYYVNVFRSSLLTKPHNRGRYV